ncbi:MAG: PAS domain S-box protein, partial [Flavobacteriales bacterium]|nr:PAS domain S-box protein [Flavobacteriales bacterium]
MLKTKNISDKRLKEFSDIISNIVSLSKRAEISGEGVNDDILVQGLNLLADKWEDTVVTQTLSKTSEEKYRSLLENINEGIIRLDNQDIIVYVNQQFCKLCGYSEKELIGKKISKMLLPFKKDRVKIETNTRGRLMGNSNEIEFPIKTKSGELIWIRSTVLPVYDNNGTVIGSQSTNTDISVQKRGELIQQASFNIAKAANRRIIDFPTLCKAIHKEIGNIMNATNFYIALCDINQTKLTFPYFSDSNINESSKRFMYTDRVFSNGLTERIIKTKKPFLTGNLKEDKISYKLLQKVGVPSKSWLGVPLKCEGKIIGVMTVKDYDNIDAYTTHDLEFLQFVSGQIALVLEKQKIQEVILSNEIHFRSLIENSSDINLLINKNREIIYASCSVERILGYKAYNLIGKKIHKIMHTDDRLYSSTAIERAFTEPNYLANVEVRVKHKNGNWCYLEATGITKISSNGEREMVINAHNITKRKTVEEQIQNTNKRLTFTHRLFERVLNNNNNIRETLKTALWGIQQNLTRCNRVSILSYEFESKGATIISEISEINSEGDAAKNVDLLKHFKSLQTMKKGSSFYCKDIRKVKNKSECDKKSVKEGILSYYIYPLFLNDKLIGSLNIGSKIPDFLSENDTDIIAEYADSVSIALKYSNLNETLKKNEKKFRKVLNTMKEAVIQVDGQGIIQYMNAKAGTYFSTSLEKAISYDISNLLPYKKSEYKNSIGYLSFMSIQSDISRQIVLPCSSESIVWGQLNIALLKDGKKISGAIIVVADITYMVEKEQVRREMIIEGEENERKRLAHDLHDGLGQTIAAANMYVNSLEIKLKSSLDNNTYGHYLKAKELINKAVIETRTISHNIMPRSLQKFGLTQTLTELTQNISEIHEKITITFKSKIGTNRFENDTELSLYRAIQEIISNAVKHSKATSLRLRLIYREGQLILNAADDGVGMPDIEEGYGLALYSMKNRINAINGTLEIFSSPNEGTITKI